MITKQVPRRSSWRYYASAAIVILVLGSFPHIVSSTESQIAEDAEWEPWATCTVSCGNGIQTRTRHVTQPTYFNDVKCTSQVRGCSLFPCPSAPCGFPGNVTHGKVMLHSSSGLVEAEHYFKYTDQENNKIVYQCDKGYKLEGTATATCTNGGWNPIKPNCVIPECKFPGLLSSFRHGKIMLDSPTGLAELHYRFKYTDKENNKMVYVCDKGYRVGGPTSATCQNGEWIPQPQPSCVTAYCSYPGALKYGKIMYVSTKGNFKSAYQHWRKLVEPGDRIEYECGEGYNLTGPAVAVCDDHGEWLPRSKPTCVQFVCDEPTPIANGTNWIDGKPRRKSPSGYSFAPNFRHNQTVKYLCNEGFRVKGPTEASCVNGEMIPSEIPTCTATRRPTNIPEFCKHPGKLKNGKILLVGVIGKYEYREYVKRVGHYSQIEFTCIKGYRLAGTPGAICINGKWDPKKKPKCKRVFCKRPVKKISNGKIILVDEITETKRVPRRIKHKGRLGYQCDTGYQLIGPFEVTCLDGDWTPSATPTCMHAHYAILSRDEATINATTTVGLVTT